MKVPPKRKGNPLVAASVAYHGLASMKVPPKRKGNVDSHFLLIRLIEGLNESPSEKEGKSSRALASFSSFSPQ